MQFLNGDSYDGFWFEDKRQGYGVLRYVKGDVYEGEWHNDRMHGKGILSHPDGSQLQGSWEQGQQVPDSHVYRYPNGGVGTRAKY